MIVSIIVAKTPRGVIGVGGDLPWHLSADLQRFKKLTMGCPIIMGRKTWQSIGRPLPGRTSIVITRQPDFEAPGALVAGSLPSALGVAGDAEEAFIIGGAAVYREALPSADRLYITLVDSDVEGDVFFPEFDESAWELTEREDHPSDARNAHPCAFLRYEKKRTSRTLA